MKKLLFLLCFLPFFARAQKLSDYGIDKVRIIEPDKVILAEIKPFSSHHTIHTDLFYYWYDANSIHSTQGGFSGKLLNGLYTEYYLNKNLKAQGNFKKGLKDGTWKSWNEDGTLSQASAWKNGALVPGGSDSFWKKLNIFKRKDKHLPADSLSKPNK